MRIRLARAVEGRQLVVTRDRAEMEPLLPRVVITAGGVPPELLERAPRLLWHQQFGTGADWLVGRPGLRRKPFVLTNCSDNHCEVLADHLFALMLSFSRGLAGFHDAQRERTWRPVALAHATRLMELHGRTLLLLGFGSIGRAVARRARAFGMEVRAIRARSAAPEEGVARVGGPEELVAMMAEADFVAVTLPLTPETRGMVGEQALRAMKPTGWIGNVGRGAVIEEDALVRALSEGWIAGAALDVCTEEPLPPTSRLWTLPGLRLTPHAGGYHDRLLDRYLEVVADNLERHAAGRPLRNLVDKERGY